MWCSREIALALVVFAALYCKVAAKRLDVEDKYYGCRDRVLQKVVESGLLMEELGGCPGFKTSWSSRSQCSKMAPAGMKDHFTAMQAYALDKDCREAFNGAVETMGGNNSFPFKTFYFLLSDAMELYKEKCVSVYHLPKQTYPEMPKLGAEIRLGSFASARSSLSILVEDLDPDLEESLVFNITSCSVLNLEKYTCDHEEVELLLSPFETFTVEAVEKVDGGTFGYSYTKISLNHSGFHGFHSCDLYPQSLKGSSPQKLGSVWIVSMAASVFVLLK